ncbi:type II CRISPR RNA-guided endonuclease Cas9 [Tenacibaculum sp. UWU-22]|uniref:type II CRISPR RNA-guided endonuclease Cas9 n=1 Tax=Tenacibaculum sp. UWU-22 TaxID=3234187 RepID=UPI0034DB56D0
MKTILGLDIGVASIGLAVVNKAENKNENSKIIKLGVRVNPLTADEQPNFEKGKPITTNAGRTLARGARRNLQRFKLRRKNLINALKTNGIIQSSSFLTEVGKNTTFETQRLRARAATEKIELEEFARVLLLINKKRGYKSSRKVNNDEEGQLIDGMSVAKTLYEKEITPGQFCYQLLVENKKKLPDFYRSDLQAELDKIWNFQKQFYPDILTDSLKKEIDGKGTKATWAILKEPFQIEGIIQKGTPLEKKLEKYLWRANGVTEKLELEHFAIVLQDINGNLKKSSGYLGAISDRSKALFFNNLTVGQYLYSQLEKDPHARLKNQVFYRQDYLDEFEKIWETQSSFYPMLTSELKKEIRDIIIFYQRRLKSQKGLISLCEFEQKEITITKDGKKKKKYIGSKVAPKSSPLFQEFKIWQILNNIELKSKEGKRLLSDEEKEVLFQEVNIKGTITAKSALEVIGQKPTEVKINYRYIEGNQTNKALYEAYLKILYMEGYDIQDLLSVKSEIEKIDLPKLQMESEAIKTLIKDIFNVLEINTEILDFDADLEGNDFQQQKFYQLWHLLYSYETDNSISGNDTLYRLLQEKFNFKLEHAKILAQVTFSQDYGSLSSKAMRRIFPYIKENKFSDACELAGYKHSRLSLTKDELANRKLKDAMEILPKNALRNPVVEKILNQMVNVVNEVIKEYGKLDEVHIELGRELKKSAEEREKMTKDINEATKKYENYRQILQSEFGIAMPSRNDIIRYRLYLELEKNAFKDLYTNTKIEKENIFSDKYDIDHIIPQSRFFDDSFSNKVLVPRGANLKKGNMTAIDYMETLGKDAENKFLSVIEDLYKSKEITKAKYEKLKKTGADIGDGFVERDLRDSQYIAKVAKNMLFEITNTVVPTSGKVTAKLREDWGLVNVLKELNLPKYKAIGLTEIVENSKGEKKEVIKDWTKRNDQRHHAMDALTIAFTTHNHIQYLNYLNARKDKNHKKHTIISRIEDVITEEVETKNGKKKRKFIRPIKNLRQEAKNHLETVLVSYKVKNKVVTKNINKTKKKNGILSKVELTPRGQLHNETIYGSSLFLNKKEEKINAKFNEETIQKVENKIYREALLKRLKDNDNDPKKAFTGKNSLTKNPIQLSEKEVLPEKVTIAWYEKGFTIRKPINPDNFKDYKNIEKVTDEGVKRILKKRLDEFEGKAKEAFSDLENNPIWQNEEKGIAIKSVTITGVKNAEVLHVKKDHFGEDILDANNNTIPVDYISTSNNHHVAIYRDKKGNLQESVVSFYEAVARVNKELPIIDKALNKDLGWEFLFTMKQNEMFVFPSDDFHPHEMDLLNESNAEQISKHLFRVQKIATKDYFFRHHLETNVESFKSLRNITWKRDGLSGLKGVVKVRTNHLGKIVQVGEY